MPLLQLRGKLNHSANRDNIYEDNSKIKTIRYIYIYLIFIMFILHAFYIYRYIIEGWRYTNEDDRTTLKYVLKDLHQTF